MRWYLQTAILSLSYFISTTVSQNIFSTIPQCYQDCLQQSGDFTCNGIDIPCLCRLSNGNYITNVLTCIRANCDNNLNTTELVGPVSQICAAKGVPIAPDVIANAENIGSSLAATATSTLSGATTVTSSYASAGTRYVVVVPLSARQGRSGVQTITGSTRTILAASITGAGRAATESGTDQNETSSSGSSATSTSTVVAVNTKTSTEVTSSSSSSASSTSTATAVNTVTSTAVAPASSSSSSSSGSGGGGSAAANANNQDGSGGGGGSGGDNGNPRQGGNGTPFISEGFISRYNRHGWLGIGVCFVVLLVAL